MYLPKSARLIDRPNKSIVEVSRCVKKDIFDLVDCRTIMGFNVRKFHNEKTNKRYVTLSKDVSHELFFNIYNVAVNMCHELDILTKKHNY